MSSNADPSLFAGQVALVTGGSRGIGRATALALAAHGCQVVICYAAQHEAAAEVGRSAAAQGWHVSTLQTDVSDRFAVDAMVARVQADFGKIDILVNNAGLFPVNMVTAISDAEWDHVISVNLTSVFYCCRAVLPGMIAAQYGAIVNIASIAGQRGSALHAHYAAAKGGVLAFTRSLAREVIQHNVRVNAVSPGRIATDQLSAHQTSSEYPRWMADTPARRLGTAEEIADAVVFLASPTSSYVVGETLAVNGGMFMD